MNICMTLYMYYIYEKFYKELAIKRKNIWQPLLDEKNILLLQYLAFVKKLMAGYKPCVWL